MLHQSHAADFYPERYVEVDAARLLLILHRFALPVSAEDQQLRCFPRHDVVSHFTPEYYLHKLDFLVRYPGYLVYELTELHRLKTVAAIDRNEMMAIIRSILANREPELKTVPFTRFWRGAYERIDLVESWWFARRLIFTGTESRGAARPQKHYFLGPNVESLAHGLVGAVDHARWYQERIELIHRFFGGFTASEVKKLQYGHREYQEAQLNEVIPDLPRSLISSNFEAVFEEPLEVSLD